MPALFVRRGALLLGMLGCCMAGCFSVAPEQGSPETTAGTGSAGDVLNTAAGLTGFTGDIAPGNGGDAPLTVEVESIDTPDGGAANNSGTINDDAEPLVDLSDPDAVLAGIQVLPADNPWNQYISALPVHPNSDAFLASIGLDTGLHPDFGTVWQGAPIGIPFVLVNGNQPRGPISFLYDDESDAGPYPIPPDAPIEGGPSASGDRHIIALDVDNLLLYELFDAHPDGDGWSAGSGAIFDLTSNDLRPAGWTSADAAGLPIFPGLVRYDEVARGEINHAIRFTVSRSQRAYISPARHFASNSTDPAHAPMGLRVRLRADYDISGFTPNVQVILRAMKTYGMIVADNGSDWYVSGAPDPRWDDNELRQLRDVKGRDFEVVYTGELEP